MACEVKRHAAKFKLLTHTTYCRADCPLNHSKERSRLTIQYTLYKHISSHWDIYTVEHKTVLSYLYYGRHKCVEVSFAGHTTVLRCLYFRAHNCVEISLLQGTHLCWGIFTADHTVVLKCPYCRAHSCVEISLPHGTQSCQNTFISGHTIVFKCLYCRAHSCVEISLLQGTQLCWNIFTAVCTIALRYLQCKANNCVGPPSPQGTQLCWHLYWLTRNYIEIAVLCSTQMLYHLLYTAHIVVLIYLYYRVHNCIWDPYSWYAAVLSSLLQANSVQISLKWDTQLCWYLQCRTFNCVKIL
jgi:hypothetical protein